MRTWRTQKGEEIQIAHMATSHIYICIKMLWNHCCPPHLHIKPFTKKYTFYADIDYLTTRLKWLVAELATRPDLEDDWKDNILFMQHNAKSLQVKKLCDSSSHGQMENTPRQHSQH